MITVGQAQFFFLFVSANIAETPILTSITCSAHVIEAVVLTTHQTLEQFSPLVVTESTP